MPRKFMWTVHLQKITHLIQYKISDNMLHFSVFPFWNILLASRCDLISTLPIRLFAGRPSLSAFHCTAPFSHSPFLSLATTPSLLSCVVGISGPSSSSLPFTVSKKYLSTGIRMDMVLHRHVWKKGQIKKVVFNCVMVSSVFSCLLCSVSWWSCLYTSSLDNS